MKKIFILAALLLSTTFAHTQVSNTLLLELTTGGDDMRAGSIGYCTVKLTDGTVLAEKRFDGPLKNNSFTNKTFTLERALNANQIKSISIRFDGGGRSFGQTQDNWDLQILKIGLIAKGGVIYLYRSSNDPNRSNFVTRFTGQNPMITLDRQ